MARRRVELKTVQIVQEGEKRLLLQSFEDGTVERLPVEATPKKTRVMTRPYWYWALKSGRRKFF